MLKELTLVEVLLKFTVNGANPEILSGSKLAVKLPFITLTVP